MSIYIENFEKLDNQILNVDSKIYTMVIAGVPALSHHGLFIYHKQSVNSLYFYLNNSSSILSVTLCEYGKGMAGIELATAQLSHSNIATPDAFKSLLKSIVKQFAHKL